tara:strand:- start:137 stop:790 length:654 start_codon:yes stop_codon:yes gene_type:complete
MTIISPSILACDFLNIESELNALHGVKDLWLHLDVMDGHFVPNLTFGHPIIKKIAKVSNHPLDAHFMVTNPEFYIETLKDISFECFTVHAETQSNNVHILKSIKSISKHAGISLRPSTDIDILSDEVLKACDLVLVMSVEPGFGGQAFMPDSIDRIKWLKAKRAALNLDFKIEVDGGVNPTNAPEIIAAGADILVAGSAVFKGQQDSYKNNIEALRG